MNTQGGPLEFDYDIKLQNFEAKLKTIETKLNGLGSNAVKQSTMVDKAWGNVMAAAGAYVSFQALTGFVSKIIEVRGEFQKLEAVLTNSFGDASKAKQALSMLADFASKTPFQVTALTQSFVKLVNQGFEPTIDDMTSLGDLASSTGKGFDQLTEAIIDAQTMEFERLKEFGIRASKEGDKVTFTFKNQKTTVDATADSIRQYVLSLGKMEGVSGSMDAISKTLVGQISNMEDSWDQLLNTLGTQTEGAFSTAIGWISKLITMVDQAAKSLQQIRQNINANAATDQLEDEKRNIEDLTMRYVLMGMNAEEAKKKATEAIIKQLNDRIKDWEDQLATAEHKAKLADAEGLPFIYSKKQKEEFDKVHNDVTKLTGNLEIYRSALKGIQEMSLTPGSDKKGDPVDPDKALKAFEKTLAEQKKAYKQYEDAKVVYGIDKAKEMYPQLLESYKAFLMQLREKYQDNPAFAGVVATELEPFFTEDQLKPLTRMKDLWEKGLKLNKLTAEEMRKRLVMEDGAGKKIKEQNESLQNTLYIYGEIVGKVGQIADAMANIGLSSEEGAEQFNKGMSNLTSAMQSKSAGEGFVKFAVQVGIDAINYYSKKAQDAIRAESEIFQLEIARIQNTIDNIDYTIGEQRNSQYLQSLRELREEIVKLYNAYGNIGSISVTMEGISGSSGHGRRDSGQGIVDKINELNYIIGAYEVVVATGRGREKSSAEAVVKQLSALKDMLYQYQDLLTEFYSSILGTTGEKISDTIRDGFENGLTSVQDFSDKTSDIIRKALMESFQTKFLDAQIQKWFLSFGNAARDGLTQQETSQAKTDLETLISNSAVAFEAYKKMMEELGVWNTGTEQSQSVLAGAIKGIQEDTANVIAGQMNAMRIIGIRQAELADSSNSYLARIAQNTENNWHLPTIASELRAIKAALSSNTSLIHSRASGR